MAAFVALEEEEGVGTPAVSVELRSEGKGTTLVSPGKVAMDVVEGVMTDVIRLKTTHPQFNIADGTKIRWLTWRSH